MKKTQDLRVSAIDPIITPRELKEKLPMTEKANETVVDGRESICRILDGSDKRMLVIAGPCSIHDEPAALEYAERLAKLRHDVREKIHLIMRVYFEKPRTNVGWKGLINDPYLDESWKMNEGLRIARDLLRRISEMGLPAATELLEPIIPQYIDDLVSWAAIGARTTESQTHREMASGLSMPVGFKNSTDGDAKGAINAMQTSRSRHAFLGVDADGRSGIVHTAGNPWGHLVLRGGTDINYDPLSVETAIQSLREADLRGAVIVDCSHDNARKQHTRQPVVWDAVIKQRLNGQEGIIGLMLESHLNAGKQDPRPLDTLQYGVSITDACINWDTTERLIRTAYEQLHL